MREIFMSGSNTFVFTSRGSREKLAVNVASFVEALTESSDAARGDFGRGAGHECDDGRCRLLRARRDRPCRCPAAEKRNEFASPHIRTQAQGGSILSAQMSTLIGAKIGIKTIAASNAALPQSVALCQEEPTSQSGNGVRSVSFMRQAPKNDIAAAAMIR